MSMYMGVKGGGGLKGEDTRESRDSTRVVATLSNDENVPENFKGGINGAAP